MGDPAQALPNGRAAVGKMEDSIIGESCEQPWLPARREGTEMRGSLKIGGAGGGVAASLGSQFKEHSFTFGGKILKLSCQ